MGTCSLGILVGNQRNPKQGERQEAEKKKGRKKDNYDDYVRVTASPNAVVPTNPVFMRGVGIPLQ